MIGSGPAGLMAAEVASETADVTVFDRMPSPARKLLLAGRGGLNLTHSGDPSTFAGRYGAATEMIGPAVDAFGPQALRHWCAGLGIETFVGSSGHVFPVGLKTSPLLRAWLRRLASRGVRLALRRRWRGWDGGGQLLFDTPDGRESVAADGVVLALGGASWPQLGSDGSWVGILQAAGIEVSALKPANCGFSVLWSDRFRTSFEGTPLKNVGLSFAGHRSRGDLVVTRAGLEGGAIYQLAAPLREAIHTNGSAVLHLELRPDLPPEALLARLGRRPPKQSLSTWLRKALHLPPVAISLLREATGEHGQALTALDGASLAHVINAVPLPLNAAMPIERAISTAGGIALGEIDRRLMLKRRPGVFVAGEMLDWEAPTGGYLLQACFALGAAAGRNASSWLNQRNLAAAAENT